MASTLLIRHAQASFGTYDYDRLSDLGYIQAAISAEYLAATWGPIARVICGRLKRQAATAEQITARVRNATDDRPDLMVDPRLDELEIDACIERLSPRIPDVNGEFHRLLNEVRTSTRSYQKVMRRVFTEWQQLKTFAGAESWPEFSARAATVLQDITRLAGPGETTVVVTSGALIAAISRHVLGLPDESTYALFEAMHNCSITHLKHSHGRISLSSFNETGFLAAMGAMRGTSNLVTYRQDQDTLRRNYHLSVHERKDPRLRALSGQVEYATLQWVNWLNNCRLLEPKGHVSPAELEAKYYR